MVDFSSAFSSGSAEFGLAGLGLSIFGGLSAMDASKQETQISQEEVGVEEQQDQVRRQAMELSAARQMTQDTRNAQSQGQMAIAAAAASGQSTMQGQQSSGLQGALGTIASSAGQNKLGISQNLQEGEQMFNLNYQLDQLKGQMAKYQGQQATDQGLMSMGSSLFSVGKLFSA